MVALMRIHCTLCARKVVLAGGNAIITGTDEVGGKPWKVKAETYGRFLIIDFSAKGGPTQVIAKWNGLGLAFQDGNVWTKR